jgi:peptidoglycan-N-acetylglucosamine deacetylase
MVDALAMVKTPRAARALFSNALWRVPTSERILYLTFDDGPVPEVTPWVLDTLKEYGAMATFFCIGKNIEAHPAVFARIVREGHTIGNHSYNHLNGWHTPRSVYLDDIAQCHHAIASRMSLHETRSDRTKPYYRPPYGKLTFAQYNYLKHRYKIVMWDVLTFDFDTTVSTDEVLHNSIQQTNSGSILVFHDSVKAAPRMQYALPKVLAHFTALGYRFEGLRQ